jgi:hypothetical protein
MSDLELLRQYEPIVRYTDGEMFYPCAVDEFINGASLWMTDEHGNDQLLIPAGELTVEKLVEYDRAPPKHTFYMRYVGEPLNAAEYQAWLRDPKRERFNAAGRLARVPLVARIGDSFFDMSLAVRGVVPGGQTAAAWQMYQDLQEKDPRRVYYGRVVRDGGWTVLHYLFFFSMNPWRSGYFGVNDHEADWEQVFVYLAESQDGAIEPQWVAYASHDFKGDDLRRRWDDPLLVKEGSHPVVFAGAGSHGSYFEQGEYQMGITPRFLQPITGVWLALKRFWVETLGQGDRDSLTKEANSLVQVPFVDYARGDGKSIGPGQDEEWTPIIISEEVDWVERYRGLWGLDTHDPLGGERAPAGPKYNRDGSVRQSWYDPLGWAGVDKLYPPAYMTEKLAQRIETVSAYIDDLGTQIGDQQVKVRELALDVQALRGTEHLAGILDEHISEADEEQAKLQEMQKDRAKAIRLRRALNMRLEMIEEGNWGPSDAHIQHEHHPEPPLSPQRRTIEVWAALSGALALLALGATLIFRPDNWPAIILIIVFAFGAIEAFLRRRLAGYLTTITIILAVIACIILFIEFWQWIILAGLIGVVLFMIRDNLRELR